MLHQYTYFFFSHSWPLYIIFTSYILGPSNSYWCIQFQPINIYIYSLCDWDLLYCTIGFFPHTLQDWQVSYNTGTRIYIYIYWVTHCRAYVCADYIFQLYRSFFCSCTFICSHSWSLSFNIILMKNLFCIYKWTTKSKGLIWGVLLLRDNFIVVCFEMIYL